MGHKITCRTLIRDLEEGGSELHSEQASSDDIIQEIVTLGVKYQIASSETSFVAVDSTNWTEANGALTNQGNGIADGGGGGGSGGGGGWDDDDDLSIVGSDDQTISDEDDINENGSECRNWYQSLMDNLIGYVRKFFFASNV